MMGPDITFQGLLLRAVPAKSVASGYEGFVVQHPEWGRFFDETRPGLIEKLKAVVRHRDPIFIDYSQAKKQFLLRYPGGFSDPGLCAGKTSEIGGKRRLVALIGAEVPLAQALAGEGSPDRLASVYASSGIFGQFEMRAIQTALADEKLGPAMLRIVARFAAGDVDVACKEFERKFKGAKLYWPVLTLPAAMWCPEKHAFLQPEAGKKFARGVGHDYHLAYKSTPNPKTYGAYLEMMDELAKEIAELGPKDYIDLQSFAHVTVNYALPPEP